MHIDSAPPSPGQVESPVETAFRGLKQAQPQTQHPPAQPRGPPQPPPPQPSNVPQPQPAQIRPPQLPQPPQQLAGQPQVQRQSQQQVMLRQPLPQRQHEPLRVQRLRSTLDNIDARLERIQARVEAAHEVLTMARAGPNQQYQALWVAVWNGNYNIWMMTPVLEDTDDEN